MSTLNLELVEISDDQVLAAFESVANRVKEMGAQSIGFQAFVLEGEPARQGSLDEIRGRLAAVLAEHGFLVRRLASNLQLRNNGGTVDINFTRQANGTASVSMSVGGALEGSPPDLRTEIVVAFNRAFAQFHRQKIFAQLLPEIAEFYTRRDSTLLRLEEIATRAAENTEAHRRKLDEQFEARRLGLDAEYKDLADRMRAESELKLQSIGEKEKALAKREAELEKADNTHARRKLRQDLKSVLKERHAKFAVTRETENKRLPIVWSFLGLMVVTLGAAGYFAWLAAQQLPQEMLPWVPSLRLAAALAAFAGATVYFIRWQDRWSQIHADEEFRLKRLDLDVDRASWLVEVLLEWRGEEGREIPPELIDRLANGLFDPGKAYPSATHPVEDAIASLLASPASLKLKLPGGEVNLDKKAIDRARSLNE